MDIAGLTSFSPVGLSAPGTPQFCSQRSTTCQVTDLQVGTEKRFSGFVGGKEPERRNLMFSRFIHLNQACFAVRSSEF